LRHHLEWRARALGLEAFDRAAGENFARHDGEPFDPTFYLEGEEIAPGTYRVDDDYFLDRVVPHSHAPSSVDFLWQGRAYRIRVPPVACALPSFLTVHGVADPPAGDLVLVLRRRPGLRDLFREPQVVQAAVQAEPGTRDGGAD
jgi:hypothetical protein